MPITSLPAPRLRGVVSSVPERRFDNLSETSQFPREEVDKVVRMAGVKHRHVAGEGTCSSDLCEPAAQRLLQRLEWEPSSVDALIFVTQSPDYFLPSTACVAHRKLGLREGCAAFDLGLGCSGYPYGLWLATLMLNTPGFERVLLLHGETPTRFALESDRSVALLFGDAGSATALERPQKADAHSTPWWFQLNTDGAGSHELIIEGGAFRNRFPSDARKSFVSMNGAAVFNFTVQKIPALIESTLKAATRTVETIDYFLFHQSNLFILRHLAKKTGIPEGKMPLSIQEFGSAGGPSLPLTMTQGRLQRPTDRPLDLLLLGYGVGWSWGSACIQLPPDAVLDHVLVARQENQEAA